MAPTSPRKRGGSVRVRGTCSAGHVTETTSDPGRVTWNGPCADGTCTQQVYAKRVPRDVRPPVDPAAQTPEDDDETTVREVDFNVPQPKRGRGEPRLPEEPAGDHPGAEDEPVLPSSVPVVTDEQPGSEQPPGDRRRGADLVGRLRGKRGDEQREVRRFQHPLEF